MYKPAMGQIRIQIARIRVWGGFWVLSFDSRKGIEEEKAFIPDECLMPANGR